MINLNELQVFLQVVDSGSFSRAAKRLNLSQPAVSQSIRSLEKNLEVDLFIRSGRRVTLSEAGQALTPMARELVTSARRVKETMASLSGDVIGEINIGCSTSSGKYILPRLIASFRQLYPHVRINILIGDRRRVTNWLLEGRVNLAVSSRIIEHRHFDLRPFFTDRIELIVPAGHRWAAFGRIFPEDVLDEPVILREEGSGTTSVLFEALREFDISADMMNVSMILGNAEAIEMAVAEGLGVAFISQLSAARGLELGRVVPITVEGLQLEREIYVLRNHNHPATNAQNIFWDFIDTHDMSQYIYFPLAAGAGSGC